MAEKKPKPELPLSLRAGNIQPMEGMAALKPAEYYVADGAYIGYPMIRGQRIFVVADGGEVKYQVDKAIVPAPDSEIDEAFIALHNEVGAFVLEGVVVYPDTSKKANKSDGEKAKTIEEKIEADIFGGIEVNIYRALYLKNDLRQLAETYRYMVAIALVQLMAHPVIKTVRLSSTAEEKKHLMETGAIWVLGDVQYRSGVDEKRQSMVYSAAL